MAPKRLVFVTGNKNKLREVTQILALSGTLELDSQDLDIPELQGTTQEVARDKCARAAALVGGPVITEDTALCFAALKGLPGAYIKHFLTALGTSGLPSLLAGFESKRATALCTFGYCARPGATVILFEGATEGTIVPAPRGPQVFGWDAVFEPDEGEGLTYAEMEPAKKNIISHRGRALEKLKAYLETLEPEVE